MVRVAAPTSSPLFAPDKWRRRRGETTSAFVVAKMRRRSMQVASHRIASHRLHVMSCPIVRARRVASGAGEARGPVASARSHARTLALVTGPFSIPGPCRKQTNKTRDNGGKRRRAEAMGHALAHGRRGTRPDAPTTVHTFVIDFRAWEDVRSCAPSLVGRCKSLMIFALAQYPTAAVASTHPFPRKAIVSQCCFSESSHDAAHTTPYPTHARALSQRLPIQGMRQDVYSAQCADGASAHPHRRASPCM